MRERPIIFNANMVRAVLDGRKTMTRRIMHMQPSADFSPMNMELETDFSARWFTPGVIDKEGYLQPAKKEVFGVASEEMGYICPFGAVGDRLWVRETWQGPLVDEKQMHEFMRDTTPFCTPEFCQYAANGGPKPEYCDRDDNIRYGWRPSIHMPRWASRINLEITGVRVERLQDISEEDAKAEGAPTELSLIGDRYYLGYRSLWKSIYGDESWQANPWVWVIEFKRVEVA